MNLWIALMMSPFFISCVGSTASDFSRSINFDSRVLHKELEAVDLDKTVHGDGRRGLPGVLMDRPAPAASIDGKYIAWTDRTSIYIATFDGRNFVTKFGFSFKNFNTIIQKILWLKDDVFAVSGNDISGGNSSSLMIVGMTGGQKANIISSTTIAERLLNFEFRKGTFLLAVERIKELILLKLNADSTTKILSHLGASTPNHHSGEHNLISMGDDRFFYALGSGSYTNRNSWWSYIKNWIYHPAVLGAYDISIPKNPKRIGSVIETKGLSDVTSNSVEPIVNMQVGQNWIMVSGTKSNKFFALGAAGIGEEIKVPDMNMTFKDAILIDMQTLISVDSDYCYSIWQYSTSQKTISRIAKLDRKLSDEAALAVSGRSLFKIGNLVINTSLYEDGYDAIDVSDPKKPTFSKVKVLPFES